MKQVLDHGERGVTLKPNKLFVAIWTNFFEFTSTTPHCIVAKKVSYKNSASNATKKHPFEINLH